MENDCKSIGTRRADAHHRRGALRSGADRFDRSAGIRRGRSSSVRARTAAAIQTRLPAAQRLFLMRKRRWNLAAHPGEDSAVPRTRKEGFRSPAALIGMRSIPLRASHMEHFPRMHFTQADGRRPSTCEWGTALRRKDQPCSSVYVDQAGSADIRRAFVPKSPRIKKRQEFSCRFFILPYSAPPFSSLRAQAAPGTATARNRVRIRVQAKTGPGRKRPSVVRSPDTATGPHHVSSQNAAFSRRKRTAKKRRGFGRRAAPVPYSYPAAAIVRVLTIVFHLP
mgnify:CR=1 FL=1